MRIILLLGLLAVIGCGDDNARELLDDYLARVNNATGTPAVAPGAFPTELVPYPRPRDLRVAQQDLRVGLLDLVSLEQCGLAELVSARNSGLGKVMTPSQRLIYEHRFLALARTCVDTLARGDDRELHQLMREVVATKERDIGRAFWNATFAGPEFADQFSLATALLPAEASGGATEEALRYLVGLRPRLGQADLIIDSQQLEGYFHALQDRRYGGQLLHALEALTRTLDGAAGALEQRLEQRAVCLNSRPTPDARVLHTVFGKFYAGRVQPYLARVHRQSQTYFALIDRLAETTDAPGAFAAYREAQLRPDTPHGPQARFAAAIQRHAAAWQRLFDQCSLSAAPLASAQ